MKAPLFYMCGAMLLTGAIVSVTSVVGAELTVMPGVWDSTTGSRAADVLTAATGTMVAAILDGETRRRGIGTRPAEETQETVQVASVRGTEPGAPPIAPEARHARRDGLTSVFDPIPPEPKTETAAPGGLVRVQAAASLQSDPWAPDIGLVLAGVFAILAALAVSIRGPVQRSAIPLGIAACASLAAEIVAWSAERFGGATFRTMPFHAAVAALLAAVFLYMLLRQRLRLDDEQRERDAMRQVLEQVVRDNSDGIVVFDERYLTIAASSAAATILAVSDTLVGQDARTYLPSPVLGWLDAVDRHGQKHCTCDIAGQTRTLELVVNFSVIGPALASRHKPERVTCLMFKDATDRLRQQQRLAYLVKHEPVTGALSRSALAEAIDAQLEAGKPMRVVIVRLNRLRMVTTSLGHRVSEAVLRQIYRRLRGIGNVEAARLGSDVFGIAVVDNGKIEDLIRQISETLDRPYVLDDRSTILESVFGASLPPTASSTAADLLRQAEIALSAHEEKARRNFTLFTPELAERIEARQELDGKLRQALAGEEFFLLFQPQVDLRSTKMVGVEALVRWKSPGLGVVPPADFIPLAEETGLIVSLGDWVMKEACRQAAGWRWSGRLSVNVSPVQFRLGDVVKTVRDAVTSSGFDVRRLDIEITESLFAANDEHIVEALEELRRLGAGVAIDDFGTGYSSLSYLATLPVDKIKIDQSFVKALPGEQSKAIIETIVSMAARLDKTVVAEGIETQDQLDYLATTQCQVGQGYIFGRPVEGDDLWHLPNLPPTRSEGSGASGKGSRGTPRPEGPKDS